MLRSIGEELDPQTRREAEAFAYEGRTPATDACLRREASGSRDAAAVATGRSLSSGNTARRIPEQGPKDPERTRKGKDYLARRNQLMHEMQQKRRQTQGDSNKAPSSPTSFDALVDDEGKLKTPPSEEEKPLPSLPSVPTTEPVPLYEMREMAKTLVQPLLAGESSSSAAWQVGERYGNPFADEYELERSITPKPPTVPPKIELENKFWVADKKVTAHANTDSEARTTYERGLATQNILPEAGSATRTDTTTPQQDESEQQEDGLSYEEQLAIALSLSESEGTANSATVRQQQHTHQHDHDLRAAIEASLRDMDGQQAAHAVAHAEPERAERPLVDVTPDPPTSIPQSATPMQLLDSLFDRYLKPRETDPPTSVPAAAAVSDDEDELYSITPQLTRARLATHAATYSPSPPTTADRPYDPVYEAVQQQQQAPIEASFYSAPSSVVLPSSSSANQPFNTGQQSSTLIDITDISPPPSIQPPVQPTPHSPSPSSSFRTEWSASDAFASVAASQQTSPKRPTNPDYPTHGSLTDDEIEVIDITNEDDSDVDLLSDVERAEGVRTPDSWSEVGSLDGGAEVEGNSNNGREGNEDSGIGGSSNGVVDRDDPTSLHTLQDYQERLKVLEEENKRRLVLARQASDVGSTLGLGYVATSGGYGN